MKLPLATAVPIAFMVLGFGQSNPSDEPESYEKYPKDLEVNRADSLAHYRMGQIYYRQRNYQASANEFREALNGDKTPKWTEVWSHIELGRIFDITGQRERAIWQYKMAEKTEDDTQGAQAEVAKCLKSPYKRAQQ